MAKVFKGRPVVAGSCTEHAVQSGKIAMGYARFLAERFKKGIIDIEKISGFGKREAVKSVVQHTFFKQGRNIVF